MERFQFLKTYADSLNELAKADQGLAEKLAWRIIQYWIYENNENSWNPVVEAMFVQIKLMLDNWKEISEKRRKANQKRTNIEQKITNDEQKWTKINKTGTNDEQNEPKDKIEKIKKKKENIKEENKENNNLKVISDTEQEYWNSEINLLINLIKNFNWWIIDWTIKEQRQYGYLLLQKLKKLPSVEEWKFKRNEVLETILRIISQSKYHSWKIVSTEKIFRNLTLLMQECKKEFQKAEMNNLVITTI